MQLACARIGAVHSVVFAGFSAESLAGRICDSKPSVVLCCSSVKRGPKAISLKVSCLHQYITGCCGIQNDSWPQCDCPALLLQKSGSKYMLRHATSSTLHLQQTAQQYQQHKAASRHLHTCKTGAPACKAFAFNAVRSCTTQGVVLACLACASAMPFRQLARKSTANLLQTIVDDALDITEKEGHAVKHVAVLDHKLAAKRSEVPWKEGRDIWWQDVMDALSSECPVEWVDAEAPLFKVCMLVPHALLTHGLNSVSLAHLKPCSTSIRLNVYCLEPCTVRQPCSILCMS